mmetsp:Transcript_30027/g.82022  ORF Transcript_30027/g.82022 Transcript_30027/m.82022 type:complete len:145 (+) Transcript_30027:629-1063(+)
MRYGGRCSERTLGQADAHRLGGDRRAGREKRERGRRSGRALVFVVARRGCPRLRITMLAAASPRMRALNHAMSYRLAICFGRRTTLLTLDSRLLPLATSPARASLRAGRVGHFVAFPLARATREAPLLCGTCKRVFLCNRFGDM